MATFNNGESGSSVRAKINAVLQHTDGTAGELVINEAGADVDFRVESDTNVNALFLDGASGNVGIGLSSSGDKLDVNGTSFFRGNMGVFSPTGGAVTSSMLTFGSAALINAARIFSNTESSTAGSLVFQTAQTGTGTLTERLRIDASGNVGIGTSSPARRLSVSHGGTDGTQVQINGTTDSAGIKFVPVSGDEWEVQANGSSQWFVYNRTDNASRLMIDGSGNLGLGVVPSAWSQGGAIEVVNPGYGLWNGTNSIYSIANAYFNSGFKYANTGQQASHYYQFQGQHIWSNAPSGTAGNAITFTQAMTLEASGNLLLGTTGANLATAGRIEFAMKGGANGAYTTFSDNTSFFSYLGGASSGTTLATVGSSPLVLATNSTERARIDASGNLGVGTASPNAASIIDAQSTTKGVRFPNMTTAQKNAIANVAGNVIFDTDLGKLCVNTGSGWQTITSA